MWVLYEHPDADFQSMSMDFMDIRKRIYKFPKMGEKAMMVAIPTSSGTGSEVTPSPSSPMRRPAPSGPWLTTS